MWVPACSMPKRTWSYDLDAAADEPKPSLSLELDAAVNEPKALQEEVVAEVLAVLDAVRISPTPLTLNTGLVP